MKKAITDELNSLGGHIIFVEKFQSSTDQNYPWWKYIKRPETKYSEMGLLKIKMPQINDMAFLMSCMSSVEDRDIRLTGVTYYGVSEKFDRIQDLSVGLGHYFQASDFEDGKNLVVIGYEIAMEVFGSPQNAIGKKVRIKNDRNAIVIGVIKKQGKSILEAWNYDHSVIMTCSFMRQLIREPDSTPVIMVKGDKGGSIDNLREEVRGAMRAIRKLDPYQEDNFALNDIGFFARFTEPLFMGLNIGGWSISALSLFVGMFGVANIMFVIVRERTSQIGLKKAIGAKKINIITEFLIESIILCLIGGIIGLGGVFILTRIFSMLFSFRVFIPLDIILLAFAICIFIGVLAGMVPAVKAANMDPVVAIRS
jgi:putative ABC transport system permease protein